MATDLTRRFLDTFKPEKDQAITDGKTERLKARFHIFLQRQHYFY